MSAFESELQGSKAGFNSPFRLFGVFLERVHRDHRMLAFLLWLGERVRPEVSKAERKPSVTWQEALAPSRQAFFGAEAGESADPSVCISRRDANRFIVSANGAWNEHAGTREEVNDFLADFGIDPTQPYWRGQW